MMLKVVSNLAVYESLASKPYTNLSERYGSSEVNPGLPYLVCLSDSGVVYAPIWLTAILNGQDFHKLKINFDGIPFGIENRNIVIWGQKFSENIHSPLRWGR